MKGHGFIPDVIEPDHWILGASPLPKELLVPDGNWTSYLPLGEVQNRNSVETYNCSAYGSLNGFETILKRRYGQTYDFSERYVGILSGTKAPGNSPHKVLETIRTLSGLIPESSLPFDSKVSTLSEYYSPVPMTYSLSKQGLQFLAEYEIGHDWLWEGSKSLQEKQNIIKATLPSSPVPISVYAWIKDPKTGLYYKPAGEIDQHWVLCFNYKEGEYWEVFDSYDESIKKVAWNTDFMQAKRLHIIKKDPLVEQQKLNILSQILSLVGEWIGKLKQK